MGILNGTIANSPTISITGGTAVTLTQDGLKVNNGVHVVDMAVTDYVTRPGITFKSNMASINPNTGEYGRHKFSATVCIPKVLTSGKVEFPSFRLEFSPHPENTAAEILKMKEWAVQAIQDADFSNFWNGGALS